MVLIKSKPQQMMHAGVFPHGFNSILNSFFEESGIKSNPINFIPQADIIEKDKQYEINISLPGVKKEDVKISLESDLLTVEGERKLENTDESSGFLKREISYGKFSRSFSLGKVDSGRIEAVFIDGILNISLPKLAEEKATTIVIK